MFAKALPFFLTTQRIAEGLGMLNSAVNLAVSARSWILYVFDTIKECLRYIENHSFMKEYVFAPLFFHLYTLVRETENNGKTT
jgi:hypothetical protein